MRLNVADFAIQLNKSLAIEYNISNGLIRIKMNFSVGRQSQFTIFNLNLFNSFKTNFLRNLFGAEIFR